MIVFKDYQRDGRRKHPLYQTYYMMMYRCLPESATKFPNHAGKNISVCDRWANEENGFYNFVDDMGDKPSRKHSLDRINNNGNYEPHNCRWATSMEQMHNRSNSLANRA